MSEWQPIETAPKDGTLVETKRVYQGSTVAHRRSYFGNVTIHYSDGTSHQFTNVWVDEDGQHLMPAPTHWKPQPAKGTP